jgi:hypothetical protein
MPILFMTPEAKKDLRALQEDPSQIKVLKAVIKTLKLMEVNLRHPSLHTHEYHTFKGPNGEKVFEAYAQNKTPGAYRVFWYYGPAKDMISIIGIIPHP